MDSEMFSNGTLQAELHEINENRWPQLILRAVNCSRFEKGARIFLHAQANDRAGKRQPNHPSSFRQLSNPVRHVA